MKLEDILAKQIGDLMVANARLGIMLELAKSEIAKLNAALKGAEEAQPELPIKQRDGDHLKEFLNVAN